MASLFGICHLTRSPLLIIQSHRETFMRYAASRVSECFAPDYDINENLLLTEENRKRCLEKMCRAPPVGIRLRGTKSETKFAAILIALCTDEKMLV